MKQVPAYIITIISRIFYLKTTNSGFKVKPSFLSRINTSGLRPHCPRCVVFERFQLVEIYCIKSELSIPNAQEILPHHDRMTDVREAIKRPSPCIHHSSPAPRPRTHLPPSLPKYKPSSHHTLVLSAQSCQEQSLPAKASVPMRPRMSGPVFSLSVSSLCAHIFTF